MKIDTKRLNDLKTFEKSLGYEFKNKDLLNQAFIHSSYSNENQRYKNYYNERLEFLGDAVLELLFTETIFKKYKSKDEGYLTKLRSQLVCEKSFSKIADEFNLNKYLLLGKGEESTGGRNRPSIKADVFEALCGAIYLDGGYGEVLNVFGAYIENIIASKEEIEKRFIDYKSQLQEFLHKNKVYEFKYILYKEEGLPHEKIFYMDVYVNSKKVASGIGKNKKQSEQEAAKNALIKYGVLYEK